MPACITPSSCAPATSGAPLLTKILKGLADDAGPSPTPGLECPGSDEGEVALDSEVLNDDAPGGGPDVPTAAEGSVERPKGWPARLMCTQYRPLHEDW